MARPKAPEIRERHRSADRLCRANPSGKWNRREQKKESKVEKRPSIPFALSAASCSFLYQDLAPVSRYSPAQCPRAEKEPAPETSLARVAVTRYKPARCCRFALRDCRDGHGHETLLSSDNDSKA